ncbi:DeoR/GlpR family DNA-binding transcription regulator [Brachybacterium alimentarium]|uniref:DeoR/GlpR family DNA-binding transcription regulator n=1 Tax=Brachybacterium alimentarium TaxID=47845 RepID=UPI000DF47FC1|nr:DeoR/GlpR family DNA-binding transcription regulator [Brachybacterium alimentarium]RCS75555.1 DeoR/GlpR transcriptional regulator [Brachybacterium alimentarium]
MIRVARLDAIESMVREHRVVSTQQIADTLGISGTTARRDLDDLVAACRIERVHGGARVPAESAAPAKGSAPASAAKTVDTVGTPSSTTTPGTREDSVDDPFHVVLSRNSEVKQALARVAASRIQDGQTLFLDIGTTVYELARLLVDRRLTVVTNSLGVVELLSSAAHVELVVLGGEFNPEYRCTQGPSVLNELSALHIDVAILGCAGITEGGAVRDTDSQQAVVKRAVTSANGTTILLADSSKIPGIGAYTALELDDVDRLITNEALPAPLRDRCTASATEVETL